jgi:hypothetical protein
VNECPHHSEINPIELDRNGGHYVYWVERLTRDDLHSKADIAQVLGWYRREIEALRVQVAEANRKLLAPGEMYCAKCNYAEIRTSLYIRNGTTGPGNSTTGSCPNGCGPLWPVTWEKSARDSWARCEAIFEGKMAEKQARESAEARLARLRGAVEKAPHGVGCQHSYRSGSTAGQFSAWSCTCWKATLTDSEVGRCRSGG